MAPKGSRTSITAPAAAKVTAEFRPRRHRLMGAPEKSGGSIAFSGMAPRRGTASYGPHQELGQNVDEDSHDKQGQTNLDQCTEIEIASGLAELVGDDAGH